MTKVIAIEGGIGAGKSTLLAKLERRGFIVVPEPVEDWTWQAGSNPLAHFYADPTRWGFTFQVLALQSRVRALARCLQAHPEASVVFVERSVQCDREVFVRMAVESGAMTKMEESIYLALHETLTRDAPCVSAFVHLNSDPLLCMERSNARARDGEAVPLDYHERLHDAHRKWLSGLGCVCVMRDNSDASVSDLIASVCAPTV